MKTFGFLFLVILFSATAAFSQQRFVASLTGSQEVPVNASVGKGTCTIVLNAAQTQITVNCTFSGLGSNATVAHIHGNAAVGATAPPLFDLGSIPAATSGTIGPLVFSVTPTHVTDMRRHLHYANIHSLTFPNGEIRGQIKQANTVYDNDGDGRTDAVVFRQSNTTFYTLSSLSGNFTNHVLGTGSADIFLNNTCDFDGDGKGDPLLIKLDNNKVATWTIYQTGTNTIRNIQWGNFAAAFNDVFATADYDGDGSQDVAVFRRSTGDWWIIESSTDLPRVEHWGTTNDFPSVGDYDGDGRADLTTIRVESGQRVWYIRGSADGAMTRVSWGLSSDSFFFFGPFDVDGDGKQDVAVNRPVNDQRVYFILRSSDGQIRYLTWGFGSTANPPDVSLLGDYDGDGRTDIVARRNVGGNLIWLILISSSDYSQSQQRIVYWGVTGDL